MQKRLLPSGSELTLFCLFPLQFSVLNDQQHYISINIRANTLQDCSPDLTTTADFQDGGEYSVRDLKGDPGSSELKNLEYVFANNF